MTATKERTVAEFDNHAAQTLRWVFFAIFTSLSVHFIFCISYEYDSYHTTVYRYYGSRFLDLKWFSPDPGPYFQLVSDPYPDPTLIFPIFLNSIPMSIFISNSFRIWSCPDSEKSFRIRILKKFWVPLDSDPQPCLIWVHESYSNKYPFTLFYLFIYCQ